MQIFKCQHVQRDSNKFLFAPWSRGRFSLWHNMAGHGSGTRFVLLKNLQIADDPQRGARNKLYEQKVKISVYRVVGVPFNFFFNLLNKLAEENWSFSIRNHSLHRSNF
jgi:hypothetical protein